MTVRASILRLSLFLSFLTLFCTQSFGSFYEEESASAATASERTSILNADDRDINALRPQITHWVLNLKKGTRKTTQIGKCAGWNASLGFTPEALETILKPKKVWDEPEFRSFYLPHGLTLFRNKIVLRAGENQSSTMVEVHYTFSTSGKFFQETSNGCMLDLHEEPHLFAAELILSKPVPGTVYDFQFTQEERTQNGHRFTVPVEDNRIKVTDMNSYLGGFCIENCARGTYFVEPVTTHRDEGDEY